MSSVITILPAVWAVARREFKMFFRYPSWFISLLIWPSLFPIGYIFVCKALAGPNGESLSTYASYAGTTDYISYILIGTFMWMWLNVMLWGFGQALRTEQIRGTLESNWLAPLQKWFLLLGSSVYDMLRWTMFMVIAGVEFYFIFGFRVQGSIWLMLLVVLLSIPSIYGVGMVFASLVLWAKQANTPVNVVRGVMMVFTGMTYPIAVLPQWMQVVSRYLPLTHSIEAARAVAAGSGWEAISGNVEYLLISGVILFILGFAGFGRTERIISQHGSLGHH